MTKNFKKFLLELTQIALEEELERQEELMSFINSSLSKLDEEKLKIVSITPSNKSDMALVVRFEDKENIEKARNSIKNAIKSAGISLQDRVIPKFDSSIECTEVSYSDGSGRVYIVYKYDIGSREGLALEHVVGLVLTGKITDELKNRLNLPPEASKQDVKQKLKDEFADVLQIALNSKKMIEEKTGKIISSESLGSKNSKADLILTNEDGAKYGLSIKLVTEEGREIRFTYNKNIGYGDEEEDNLVKNPSGKPWWIVGRQIFAKKLGRSYNPKKDNFEPPSWMEKAKENKKDLYKEAMEEVYEQIRDVFISNLRKMKLKDLVAMVNEAQLGSKEERKEYQKLFVLVSDVDGLRVEEKKYRQPDIEKISGLSKKDIIMADGAKIIIDIPGLEPLTIHGLKFQNNMLSSSMNDLKIKTR
jgi:hypothetical protein